MLVVMKRAFIHSFHLLLVCLSVSSETNTEFKTNCHIHDTTDNNNHSLSPESVFLQEATSLWLYPSQDEIMKYYEKGYKSCNEFLKQHTFNIDIAPIYTDPNGIDFNGQLKCRGMDTLYSVTGLIMYPFGPIDSCSTYSKCWHGILSCGTFNADNVMSVSQKAIEHILHKKHPNGKIPTLKEFSMKSMQIFTRLVGPEIVVPEQRYLTLSNSASVIIGQYTLTRPPNPPTTTVTLEMRLQEFIPGILIDWTANQKQEHGLYSTGTVYLGGSEGRCRAWTNCNTPYYCCGCDEKSFLPTAPISVNVIDGYNRCPNLVSTANGLNSFKQPALPLCTLLKQAGIIDHPPGRWLLSTEPSHEGEVCSKDNKSNVFRQHKDINDATPQEIDIHTRSPVTRINSTWSTASGDPCIINSHKGEEGGHRHYFYAPYACKYHFFTGSEARHCLAQSNRTHIHFQGDSMSRDLFSAVASYLGVSALSEKEVKKLTNEKHERHIQLGSNETILTESKYLIYTILVYFLNLSYLLNIMYYD